MSECQHCHVPLKLDAAGCCENCGQSQPAPVPVPSPEPIQPTLRLDGYLPGTPLGECSTLQLRFTPTAQDYTTVSVQLHCGNFSASVQEELLGNGDGHHRILEFTPVTAGHPRLRVDLQARDPAGGWHCFHGETQLLILGPGFDASMVESWFRGLTVRINNRRGLVRIEDGASLEGVSTLEVDTEEGLTRLKNALVSSSRPPALGWDIPLYPVDRDDIITPQPLTLAHLRHADSGLVTQLIPWWEELVLGRAADAHLQLRLFPLDMDQLDISRRWVRLLSTPEIQVQDIRERGLDRSTRLDDTPLGMGEPPSPWLPGQTLILKDLLGLRYRADAGGLHLSRELNGEEREDYLLLRDEGYPLGSAAHLQAARGGFLLRALDGTVRVNSQMLPVDQCRGLWDGDMLELGARRLSFHAGRDDGKPGQI